MNGIFIQQGDAIDFTPDRFIPAGEIIRLGSLIGITKSDIKPGEPGSITVNGVFSIQKNPSVEIPPGLPVLWDTAKRWAGISGDVPLGLAVSRAAVGQNRVHVLLNRTNSSFAAEWAIL